MVRALERIERDLAQLDESLTAIAQELYDTYKSYLTTLGRAARQQLITAVHHICTQGYPKDFLQLSFNQRQQLQQKFRQTAAQLEAQLTAALTHPLESSEADTVESVDLESEQTPLQLLRPLLEQNGLINIQADTEIPEISSDIDADNQDLDGQPDVQPDIEIETEIDAEPRLEIQAESQAAELLAKALSEEEFTHLELSLTEEESRLIKLAVTTTAPADNSLPMQLLRWHKALDKKLTTCLKTASREANRQLQKASILPKELPEQIIAAATQADAPQGSSSTPPNLISLLIETGLITGSETWPDQDVSQNIKEDAQEDTQEAPQEISDASLTDLSAANLDSEPSERLKADNLNAAPEQESKAGRTRSKRRKKHSVTPLVAIHLRLSEIEFADVATSAERRKVQQVLNQLSSLGQKYQKRQREKTIAEAEAAWRTSWFDD